MLSLRINGIAAQSFGYGYVGDLEVAHLYSSTGGGLQYVKFSLALPRRYSHPALIEGALVEVLRGGQTLGTAVLSDVDRDGWTFTADGLYRRAEHFNAEGADNSPAVIVAEANMRGLGWNGIGNLPTAPILVEGNTRLTTVAAVLNEYCRLNNKRWGLGFDGTPYIADDPTEPSVALRPGTPAMPTADDDYVSRVVVQYLISEASETETAVIGTKVAVTEDAPAGAREAFEDVTNQGVIGEVLAQTYADAFIAANVARRGFTAGVEVGPGQLTNLGGVAIDPWSACFFALGNRVLQHNVLETDGRAAYGRTRTWVVGSTIYKSDGNSLTLTPTGLLPRTMAQVFAAKDAA